jgi:NADPH:quinone reductase-like Zn-dependent oxidoreductase
MRVFQIEGGWGMDHLVLSSRPDPRPGAGEVLLRMKAASLNYRDLVVPDRGYGQYTGTLPLPPSPTASARSWRSAAASFQGITVGSRDGLEALLRAIGQHRLEPVVDQVFDFAELKDAMAYLASGAHFGKVCLRH